MAKRFTDSEKWKNPWFRTLPGAYRWLWIYILDNCDAAGIWMSDFGLASYVIGQDVTEIEAEAIFSDKIIQLDLDKWFIPSFITFQYGSLQSDSRPHMSVIKILEKYGIDHETLTLRKGYSKGIQTLKDKDKDKDKELDKEKDKEIRAQIEIIYSKHYPLKKGKSDGIKSAARQLKTEQDLVDFETAVCRYAEECQKKGTQAKYIKQFDSFVNSQWRDLLDPEFGTASITPIRQQTSKAQQVQNGLADLWAQVEAEEREVSGE